MKNVIAIFSLFLVLVFFFANLSVKAHQGNEEEEIFLPAILNYYPFLVANFETGENCSQGLNNLGGSMGAAYEPPDFLRETYEYESVWQSCAVKLAIENHKKWSAFWLKLGPSNLDKISTLHFDIFMEEGANNNNPLLRVELKRGCENTECKEAWYQDVLVKPGQHQQLELQLSNFISLADEESLPPLTQIEELVFSFQKNAFGDEGTVYLDDILFRP